MCAMGTVKEDDLDPPAKHPSTKSARVDRTATYLFRLAQLFEERNQLRCIRPRVSREGQSEPWQVADRLCGGEAASYFKLAANAMPHVLRISPGHNIAEMHFTVAIVLRDKFMLCYGNLGFWCLVHEGAGREGTSAA